MVDELIKYRKEHHLSREKLHKMTGIPTRTIENWELGQRVAPEYVIWLLMYFLNTYEKIRDKQWDELIKYLDGNQPCG